MANPAIEFRAVTKSYGAYNVVRELDLTVSEGEFLVLLGPSGCGKSTILKMLAGIEAPDKGEISVGGKMVNYALPRDRDVAMVFQNYALYPHMSVAENIGYPLKAAARRTDHAEADRRVRQAAETVKIADQLEKYPDALSGGQRQRVALARALIREPAAFLMDEPLSNLDAQLRDVMRHQLIELHRKIGRATIYVTHDQLEAMTMADRIVVLNRGAIQQIGSPQDIYQRPANLFVAEFIGYPRMNFLSGDLQGDRRVKVGPLDLLCDQHVGKADAPVTVGIRPSDVKLGGGINAFEGQVLRSEFTGSDTILTVASDGGMEIRFRTTEKSIGPGASLQLSIAPQDIHLFDGSGERI